MRPLTLDLRQAVAQRVDLSALRPDRLEPGRVADFAAQPLRVGRRERRLDDLFEVTGDDPTNLVIRNATDHLDGIGAGIAEGRIRIEGDAGARLGAGMSGGEIEVTGGAGNRAASQMSGGRIEIRGNCTDFLAAPPVGGRIGMTGGLVIVRGSAGARAGDRLRRGTLLIEGDAGPHCGSRLIAGTIAVLGATAPGVGAGMRRGTLVLLQPPAAFGAGFAGPQTVTLGFLRLLTAAWRPLGGKLADVTIADGHDRVMRLMGDRACDGMGEIIVPS